ncbi:MAG: N-glycosylase/DNA lyase [archaeon]
MSKITSQIEELKKTKIKEIIDIRIKEFEAFGNKKQDEVFSELCFCLLTANFQAEKCIQIQTEMSRDFEIISKEELAKKLKAVGHRFWPQRAERIVEARDCKTELCSLVFKKSGIEMREWLVKTVKGLGMKESSHFLRNVGYKDLAIIDFHIVDLLEREKLIERPKTITPKKYLEIEQVLAKLGKEVNLNLAELDLYLWYLETGKILK